MPQPSRTPDNFSISGPKPAYGRGARCRGGHNLQIRPRDSQFRGQERLPIWAATLYREPGGGGEEAPPEILAPVSALDEVIATANSFIEGRGEIASADRTSLGRDVSTSLQNLGRKTQSAIATVLRPFQSTDLAPLPRLLTDVEGARRLLSASRLLMEELSLPRTAQGASDDCVAAFRDGETSSACKLRIAQLREICEHRGHSWDALAHGLGGLLADQLYVAVSVGALEADPSGVDPDAPTGLSLERRLEVCRDEVASVPEPRESVVWLVYTNADIPNGFLRCGPVRFFTHRLPLDAIRDGCPALNSPEFERPVELSDPFAAHHFSDLPDEPYVLVRVKVSPSRIADIRAHARDLVSGLVDIASQGRSPRSPRGTYPPRLHRKADSLRGQDN